MWVDSFDAVMMLVLLESVQSRVHVGSLLNLFSLINIY